VPSLTFPENFNKEINNGNEMTREKKNEKRKQFTTKAPLEL